MIELTRIYGFPAERYSDVATFLQEEGYTIKENQFQVLRLLKIQDNAR